MKKNEFILKNYNQNIGKFAKEIAELGVYEADCGDHFSFVTKPFRIFLPELNYTIRDTTLFDEYDEYCERVYSLYHGNEVDANNFFGQYAKLKDLIKQIASKENITLEAALNAKCIFILDELKR